MCFATPTSASARRVTQYAAMSCKIVVAWSYGIGRYGHYTVRRRWPYCAATWDTTSTVDNDEKARRRVRRTPPTACCVVRVARRLSSTHSHVARCGAWAAVVCAGTAPVEADCEVVLRLDHSVLGGLAVPAHCNLSAMHPAHTHERICHTPYNVRQVVLRRTRYLPAPLHWRTERAAPLLTTASRNSEFSTRGKQKGNSKETRLLRSPESTPCAHRKCPPPLLRCCR